MTCNYCKGSTIPGIHFPSDFDDREPSKDGKVFIARCDTCDRYGSDEAAAKVVEQRLGRPMMKSYDRDDEVDPQGRAEKQGTDYFRPYFQCSLAEAEALHLR